MNGNLGKHYFLFIFTEHFKLSFHLSVGYFISFLHIIWCFFLSFFLFLYLSRSDFLRKLMQFKGFSANFSDAFSLVVFHIIMKESPSSNLSLVCSLLLSSFYFTLISIYLRFYHYSAHYFTFFFLFLFPIITKA